MDPIDTHHELEDGQSFDAIVAYKIKGHICYEGNKRHLEKSNLFPKLLTTNIANVLEGNWTEERLVNERIIFKQLKTDSLLIQKEIHSWCISQSAYY